MKDHLILSLRRSRHLSAGVAVLMLLWSCDPGFIPPPVSPQAAARAGVAPSPLASGYAIHQAKCANCHPFVDPSAYGPAQLTNEVLPPMARKAQLTATEQEAVLAYLLSVRKP